MLIITSINRSASKAVGVGKGGGVEIDKNDLPTAVENIWAFKSIFGNKVFKIFLRFHYVLLSVVSNFQIIYVSNFDSLFHKLTDILLGL